MYTFVNRKTGTFQQNLSKKPRFKAREPELVVITLTKRKNLKKRASIARTHVNSVSEDAEPLDPLEPVQNRGDVGEEASEEHHEDVGDGDERVSDGEHLDRSAHHEGDRRGADGGQDEGEQEDEELVDLELETCATKRRRGMI